MRTVYRNQSGNSAVEGRKDMRRQLQILLFFLFTLYFACSSFPVFSAETLDFAIIQPGQPGTSREAQPAMDSLAAYLQKKLGKGIQITGIYFNELNDALDFMRSTPPRWGIVSLAFFSAHAGRFQMAPIASTRPGGAEKDIWQLLVSKGAPDDLHNLTGTVWGTMFFEKDAAIRLLFAKDSERLPFAVSATSNPLRHLRSLSGEKAAGVLSSGIVLDRLQYQAMKSLPLAQNMKVIHTSKELPASPVVWFGTPDEKSGRLGALLTSMRSDPEAQELLQLLQTDGFGPADPDLAMFKMDSANEEHSP